MRSGSLQVLENRISEVLSRQAEIRREKEALAQRLRERELEMQEVMGRLRRYEAEREEIRVRLGRILAAWDGIDL